MVELDRGHVVEEVLPPGFDHEDLGRHHVPVHEGEGVVGLPGADSRHEAAADDHVRDQAGDPPPEPGGPARTRPGRRPRGEEAHRDPQERGEDQEGDREMRGQPEVRHARIVDEPAHHHVPAHRALQAAEHEHAEELPGERPADPAANPEPDERDQEHDADQPAEQSVEVLPPEDAFELRQAHAPVDLKVLGRLPVFLEGRDPIGIGQRRQGAHDRLPLDDRQTGVGEPGDAPHDDHREHERGANEQPGCHGALGRRAAQRNCGGRAQGERRSIRHGDADDSMRRPHGF
ncbi:MAG: hypothetical protein M5U08_17560 [Burkholderiales bacterium]|nr:hypothetical protein [Burkholderiales bacterium]